MVIPALDSKVSTLLENLILEPSFTLSFDKHAEEHALKLEEKEQEEEAESEENGQNEQESNDLSEEDKSALCALIPEECEVPEPKEPEIQTIEKKEIRPTQIIKVH